MQRFSIAVADGPQRGTTWQSRTDRCSIGAHPSNDLVIEDPAVSRFHCEVAIDPRGARVRDLGSRNGTVVDGVTACDVYARDGSLIRLGRTQLRFCFAEESIQLCLSSRSSFGPMFGTSAAMRMTFALLVLLRQSLAGRAAA